MRASATTTTPSSHNGWEQGPQASIDEEKRNFGVRDETTKDWLVQRGFGLLQSEETSKETGRWPRP
uniref:Clr5 domain-containing protein n=1 Tax=Meloidogyne hapla TaxID=6305 RepID=A0A1I8C2C4_MELHA